MSAATRLVEVSMDEGLAAGEALDRAESEIFSLSQKSLSKTFTSVRDTLAESFDSLMKRLQGAVHGCAGIFKNLGEGLRCGNGGGAIGDVAGSVETGMAGDDRSSWGMGGLDGRDNGGQGIQGSLDGGSIEAFRAGLIDEGLHL